MSRMAPSNQILNAVNRGSNIPWSVPVQCATSLILGHASLKKVLFFLQVEHLAHPGKGILRAWEKRIETDLLRAPVRRKDEQQ